MIFYEFINIHFVFLILNFICFQNYIYFLIINNLYNVFMSSLNLVFFWLLWLLRKLCYGLDLNIDSVLNKSNKLYERSEYHI